MNLANTELYLTLWLVFRELQLQLYGPKFGKEVAIVCEYFLGMVREDLST